MSVDTATIESMSPFVLNDDFTPQDFDTFYGWATAQVNEDIGTGVLSASKYDRAVALLICDFIAQKKTDVGMNSENLGGYTYSRGQAGKTGWLLRYETIVKTSGIQPSFGVKRNDVSTSRAFRTADMRLPSMDNDDSTLKSPETSK